MPEIVPTDAHTEGTDAADADPRDVHAVMAPVIADGVTKVGFLSSLVISAKIAAIVCVVELAIVAAFSLLPVKDTGVLYSVLLAFISGPMILVWVVRPYVAERQEAYARLTGMNEMLRREIDERMAAEERLHAHEYELQLQIQEMDYVKQLVEEQAADAVGMAEDLALQKQAVEESERRNEYLANHDVLTGLPNRRHFERRLSEMKAAVAERNGSITLIYVDLDNFKTVNDTLGHQSGDELLVQVAKRLSESVRSSDFVARLGGDEFAVVLAHFTPAPKDKLVKFADRMRAALAIAVEGPAGSIPVSATLGVATYPADATDEESLLQFADRAMYVAKQQGRNRTVFHHDLAEVSGAR